MKMYTFILNLSSIGKIEPFILGSFYSEVLSTTDVVCLFFDGADNRIMHFIHALKKTH